MSERTAVVFTSNNARIFRNLTDEQASKMISWPNCVVDPDLSKVLGISPHFWFLKDNQIIPMNDTQMQARLWNISMYGVDNAADAPKDKMPKFPWRYAPRLEWVDWAVYALILSALAYLIKLQ